MSTVMCTLTVSTFVETPATFPKSFPANFLFYKSCHNNYEELKEYSNRIPQPFSTDEKIHIKLQTLYSSRLFLKSTCIV